MNLLKNKMTPDSSAKITKKQMLSVKGRSRDRVENFFTDMHRFAPIGA
jgi:hypothetical protein